MTEGRPCTDWGVADGVGWVSLNRPPLNVLNLGMLRELQAALRALAAEQSLRVLVLRADPVLRVFSAGVDVADHTADRVRAMIPLFDAVCCALASFPLPTLAVVHGHALGGGCELALSCDLVLAAEGATFGQPEIKLATIAPMAALRLPGLVGYRRAAELLFTGSAISAAEAAEIGLINRAVPAAELAAAAEQLAGQLAALSGAALRICKQALRQGERHWETGLGTVEQLYLDGLMATTDAAEGVAAFLEKRPPVWSHS
ncbi:MAG: enoyl-CoA hydratase/isomerase family protein [Anaerolineales bacterium]|nr:enoyl-CoA hydratase/isomerase family protein [Anaerolineales bacterium]